MAKSSIIGTGLSDKTIQKRVQKRLASKLKHDTQFRRAVARARLQSLGDEFSRYIKNNPEIKQTIINLGSSSNNDEYIGRYIAEQITSAKEMKKYYEIVKKEYWKRVGRIKARHSGNRIFDKNNISYNMERPYIHTMARGDEILKGYVPVSVGDGMPRDFGFQGHTATRVCYIFFNRDQEPAMRYAKFGGEPDYLYRRSERPTSKTYDSIYMPYLINNQPVAKRSFIYKTVKTPNGVKHYYTSRTWRNARDKYFIREIVRNFNRRKDVPSWIVLDYNKEIYN